MIENHDQIDLKALSIKELQDLEKNVEDEISRYNNLQHAKKIALNSLYGSFGTKYFRFYDRKFAEAITLMGQLANGYIEKKINEYLNSLLKTNDDYIYYQDTDSEFVCLEGLVDKFISGEHSNEKIVRAITKFCNEKLQPQINIYCKELGDYLNFYNNRLSYKLEKVCSSGILIAKKRYALNVYSNEGVVYSEPKVKVTGLEIIKSSTPKIARTALKECLNLILKQDESGLQECVSKFKDEFFKAPVDSISFPISVNGIDKYYDQTTIYKKGTPINSRAAILFNHLLVSKKLDSSIEKLKDGDKIKFVYLKLPNPTRENVIGFSNTLPNEFGLEKYIDYNLMYESVFIKPLQRICDVTKYKIEKKYTIEDFFG